MIAHGELVCDSDAVYFERRHSLNARQTWRRVSSLLTAATESNNNFFRLVAIKHEVVGLSPVLYMIELRATRALVSCRFTAFLFVASSFHNVLLPFSLLDTLLGM